MAAKEEVLGVVISPAEQQVAGGIKAVAECSHLEADYISVA